MFAYAAASRARSSSNPRAKACAAAAGSVPLEAEIVLGTFRDEYNNHRPHSSLGQKTPAEIYAGTKTNADSGEAPKRVA